MAARITGLGRVMPLALLVLAGCSSAGATPRTIYVTPLPPSPTSTPVATPRDPNLGKVKFGTHYDAKSLVIDRGSMTFSRYASEVCWSAVFNAAPKHATIRVALIRQGPGTVETDVTSWIEEVTNPDYDMWANCQPLAAEAGNKAGSYVLRFLDGVKVLAQGRFILK